MNLKGVQFELISFIYNDGIKRDENTQKMRLIVLDIHISGLKKKKKKQIRLNKYIMKKNRYDLCVSDCERAKNFAI